MTKRYSEAFADAQAALPFVVEQGRTIETRIYEARYPTINYADHVPVITEGNDWAIGTQFYKVDVTGQAKFISGAANDIPFNQAVRDQGAHDYAMIGSGWEWNMEEINQAALYGIDLNSAKYNGTVRSVEQLLYDIAMRGATEKNWTGFVNDASVSRTDVANDGAGTSTFWTDKTADQILRDINDGLGDIRNETNEIEWADSVRLPPKAFRDLATRRLGAGDGMITILEFIRRNNVYTAETGAALDIRPLRDLATASNDGGGRMVIYRKDSDVVRFHLPMPRRVLGVRQKSLMAFEDGVIARTGGVEVRLPGAMRYLDEITDVPA